MDLKNKHRFMGVMNVTPNSFSDGSLHQELEKQNQTLEKMIEHKIEILDLGFESTAPMNQSIAVTEEHQRLKDFFDSDRSLLSSFSEISIDTYRFSTAKLILEKLSQLNFRGRVIWNDVSGVLDEDILKWLKLDSRCDFIYGQNFLQKREDGSQHRQAIRNGFIDYEEWFKRSQSFLSDYAVERVHFDPLPGFAKSYEQNFALLKQFSLLPKAFEVNRTWILAISKKSFLRTQIQKMAPELSKSELFSYSELSHILWINHVRSLCNSLIIRIHDPLIKTVSDNFLQICH